MERALARSRDRQVAPRNGKRRIRLMIVDDSMVARAVLSRMIESDDAFEIAAVAGTAEDALDALQAVRVDVVVLDLEMPGAGGLKLLPKILNNAAGAKVMVVSSLAEEGAEETISALAMGAADTLPKPGTGRFNGRFSEILLAKLKALGHAEIDQPTVPLIKPAIGAPLRAMPTDPIGILAIGASTGGIHAIGSLFGSLPRRIGVPILVTQHLPAPFMAVFARQLGVTAGREAVVAEDGMPLRPDVIYVAPGGAHLTVEDSSAGPIVHLRADRVPSGCLPSVDPMFASVGALFGSAGLGVVLTGMGRDGVEGASRLVASGGAILAQDEESSAIWGMPKAVIDAGLACAVMNPGKIGRRIASRTGDGSCK